MQNTDVIRHVTVLDSKASRDGYNFEHFRTKHLLSDLQATQEQRGIAPGAMAPDFELPRVEGERVRLSELRDKPTLLHFGSFT